MKNLLKDRCSNGGGWSRKDLRLFFSVLFHLVISHTIPSQEEIFHHQESFLKIEPYHDYEKSQEKKKWNERGER